jgi:hypothetical protein
MEWLESTQKAIIQPSDETGRKMATSWFIEVVDLQWTAEMVLA